MAFCGPVSFHTETRQQRRQSCFDGKVTRHFGNGPRYDDSQSLDKFLVASCLQVEPRAATMKGSHFGCCSVAVQTEIPAPPVPISCRNVNLVVGSLVVQKRTTEFHSTSRTTKPTEGQGGTKAPETARRSAVQQVFSVPFQLEQSCSALPELDRTTTLGRQLAIAVMCNLHFARRPRLARIWLL